MRHTGFASLPLHGGRAPAWLFSRMVPLSREIVTHIAAEFGPREVLRRLSDPCWFQAFGCVLGFDWHSSGVTTTVCGAVMEGLRGRDRDLGLFAAGGKGGRSRRAPAQIVDAAGRAHLDPAPLVYASRTSAKVDSAAVQDGYQLYHHAFFFTADSDWSVVQQGMNDATRSARRYHWLSDRVESFVNEPHEAVCSETRGTVLNMVAAESAGARDGSARLAREKPVVTLDALAACAGLKPCATSGVLTVLNPLIDGCRAGLQACARDLVMPTRHTLFPEMDVQASRLHKILETTYERAPEDFETLLGLEGVGPKTLRALALAAELIYGTPVSTRDPARYAFAHGGKDGTPFPVDRATYDKTIDVLGRAINGAKIDRSEKVRAFARLAAFGDTDRRPTPHPFRARGESSPDSQ